MTKIALFDCISAAKNSAISAGSDNWFEKDEDESNGFRVLLVIS